MTAKMVNLIRPAKGEVENDQCQYHPHDRATSPATGHKTGTVTGAHQHVVAQGVADGHVAVVAHDHEQEGVGEAKREGEEHLAGTGHKGDGAVGGEHVRQHARGDRNSEQDLGDGEGTQEEVHGGVEAVLPPDGAHDEQVAQQREQVHQQVQQEEGGQELLREVGEADENEFRHCAVVLSRRGCCIWGDQKENEGTVVKTEAPTYIKDQLKSSILYRWRRKWQPTPEFMPENPRGQRCLAGYSPWDCKELDMSE